MAFKRVSVFILFLCFHYASAISIKGPELELLYNVTQYNYCLIEGSRIQQFVGRDLDRCVIECALRPHCEALTYNSLGSSTLCELYQTEDIGRVIRQGCVYIQKGDITIKKIPCTGECENGTMCNMETQTCDYAECSRFPNITNGIILGRHRAVGNKIRFKCDIGYATTTERESVCQPDGQWSVSSAICIKQGVYRIYPVGSSSSGIQVPCDMDTPPGGWTVIQRRIDDRDFYKTWSEYKDGFGDVYGSFWLGNDHIWMLTSIKQYRLRIDLTAQDGMTGYAEYDHFSVANETLQYALNIGIFHGNVGDSLAYHNEMSFTTKDRDNDLYYGGNCAVTFQGAWWYNRCHESNLNGDYMTRVIWETWRGLGESLTHTELKIYPN